MTGESPGGNFDIVIAGGSFVGLTLALALVKTEVKFRVAVVDTLPPECQLDAGFDGRSLAIAAAAQRMYGVLGVWDAIAAVAQPVNSIDITDSALASPLRTVLLHFDALLTGHEPAAFIVESLPLRRALYEAVRAEPGITLMAPASVTSFAVDDSGVDVHLKGGERIRAKLLIAADGRRSTLRAQAGINTVIWDAHQTGIVTSVGHELPHAGRAVQHFLPSGPFAILPLTGNRSSLVWTETAEIAKAMLALDDAAFTAEVQKRFGQQLGAVTVLAKPEGYPLTLTLARSFVKPRFALAGDAAHGLHWIAGQGLNHGLKDVAALAEVLIDGARLGLDAGDLTALERYERWRRFDSASSAMAAAALNLLFANDFTPMRLIRDFGLGVVDRLPPLKRFFVEEAAGVTGEVPKLLKGEPV